MEDFNEFREKIQQKILDENNIKRINEKLSFIMDKIDNEINSQGLFKNEEEFLKVLKIEYEIHKLWNEVKDPDLIPMEAYVTLVGPVEDIIHENIKYYGYGLIYKYQKELENLRN